MNGMIVILEVEENSECFGVAWSSLLVVWEIYFYSVMGGGRLGSSLRLGV